jgi:hypothetical protein
MLAFLERWRPDAGLKPRPLDQATSSIKQFDKAVGKPIEQIESKGVQRWIDELINAEGETGLHSKTVNRKLGEIRNYWSWLQTHQIVADDCNPFAGRRVINPANLRRGKEEIRQRFRAEVWLVVGRLRKNVAMRRSPLPSGSRPIQVPGWKGYRNFARRISESIRTPKAGLCA